MLKSDIMDGTPITPISTESLRYWMRDQADHAIFVHNDLTADHVAEADKAFNLSIRFQGLEDIALRKKDELDSLVNVSRSSVIEFVGFQNELLREQMTGHLLAKGYPTFRDHLVRESQYFLRWIDAPTDRTSPEDILSESIFWLRQMVEHALFLTHWADPYEKSMVSDGQAFAGQFDELLARARLFASMMTPQPVPEIPAPSGTRLGPPPPLASEKNIPAVMHMVAQTLDLTRIYRSFLLELKPPEENFQNMGIITSLFMDHQTRETDYFIANLESILMKEESTFEMAYLRMPFKRDRQEEALYHLRPL